MAHTILKYLEDTYLFESHTTVSNVTEMEDGRSAIIVDETIFYPQGGGQPYDQGTIASDEATFDVLDTRFKDGQVIHIGSFDRVGFVIGDGVKLSINKDRRLLNSRIHTAGHLVDVAMMNIGFSFPPTKGYHFLDSPYVEYDGRIDAEDREAAIAKLNEELTRLIAEDSTTTTKVYQSKDDIAEICQYVPDYLPEGKPIRVATVAGYNCPCGGTHVARLSELGTVKVTKIRSKGGNARVSYQIA